MTGRPGHGFDDLSDAENLEFDAICRAKLAEAVADPRPSIPADEAFAIIRERIRLRRKGGAEIG